MDRFLIESTYTAHDCKLAVKLIQSAGYLNNFDWGCKDGVHTAWAMIEAENAAQALGVVPALMRDKAKVIKLNKFDSAMVDKWETECDHIEPAFPFFRPVEYREYRKHLTNLVKDVK